MLNVVPHKDLLLVHSFLIHINDNPNTSSKLVLYLFVDETSNYFESGNLERPEKAVSYELEHIKKWPDNKKLALNVDKTNLSFSIDHKSLPTRILNKVW